MHTQGRLLLPPLAVTAPAAEVGAPEVDHAALARVARLAAAVTGAAAGLVILGDDDEAMVGAAHALPGTVRPGQPVTRGLLAALGMPACLRAPVRGPDGFEAGAVCALDAAPRAWTAHDTTHLADLAALVEHELVLHRRLRHGRRFEAVARLAGGVAHDFNNVLAVLGTSARLVRETVRGALPPALAAEAELDLEAIDDAVGRAGALTRQLLACGGARDAEPESAAAGDMLHGGRHVGAGGG